MSPLKKSNNIAARMGRWSASHWKTAVFGWLAFVIAALVVGMSSARRTSTRRTRTSASRTAPTTSCATPASSPTRRPRSSSIQSKALTIDARAFRATVDDVVGAVKPFTTIKNLRSPLDAGHADQISADGHTALVEWDMKGDYKLATAHIDAITAATDKVAKAHPSFYVGEAGSISSGKALDKMFNEQLAQAGERSIPLTLLILLLVFGRDRRRRRAAAARALRPSRARSASSHFRATSCRWTRTSAPCSCSSGSRSASTTRSST